MELLSMHRADLNAMDKNQYTRLLLAVRYQQLHCVRFLLDKKTVKVNHGNAKGMSAIAEAVVTSNTVMIQLLLDLRKDIDLTCTDCNKHTVLHIAAAHNNKAALVMLADKVPQLLDAVDLHNETAF